MKTEDQMHEAIRVIVDHLKMELFDHDEAMQVLERAKNVVAYLYHGRTRRPYKRGANRPIEDRATPGAVES